MGCLSPTTCMYSMVVCMFESYYLHVQYGCMYVGVLLPACTVWLYVCLSPTTCMYSMVVCMFESYYLHVQYGCMYV